MAWYPALEQLDPLITFDQFLEKIRLFGRPGLLGFFNYVEATEVFMLAEKHSPPLNVFTLIVLEEHKTSPPEEQIIINAPKRITIPECKGCSFGVYRYFKPLEEFIASLQHFQNAGQWNASGSSLTIGTLTPLLPQFVPADQTDSVPLNGALKNNFWNGSYVLELFDNEKSNFNCFFTSPHQLQALSQELTKFVPLRLASLSDRLGNIIIQIPSNIGAFKLGSSKNDENFYSFAWREGVKKRRTQLVAVSEVDRSIIAFGANQVSKGRSWELSIGKAPKIDRTYLFDLENQILLASSQTCAFIKEINLEMNPIDSEPRTIYLPANNGDPEKIHLHISSSMGPTKIGQQHFFNYKKWIQKRIYQAEMDTLQAQKEFVQYGLVSDEENEHNRALVDIRALLQQHGRKEVLLWDPFLSAHDIMKTLFFTPHFGSRLRALTSGKACTLFKSQAVDSPHKDINAETWKRFQVDILNTPGNNYRGLQLEFRISYGPSVTAFHDRFLIFPDTNHGPVAWSLGTSVNSLGKSHHILQKVVHARPVADAFQVIWNKLEDNKYLVWKRP